jgi:hypothetical protein
MGGRLSISMDGNVSNLIENFERLGRSGVSSSLVRNSFPEAKAHAFLLQLLGSSDL